MRQQGSQETATRINTKGQARPSGFEGVELTTGTQQRPTTSSKQQTPQQQERGAHTEAVFDVVLLVQVALVRDLVVQLHQVQLGDHRLVLGKVVLAHGEQRL